MNKNPPRPTTKTLPMSNDEESDGSIDDRKRKKKRDIARGIFPSNIYIFSRSGIFLDDACSEASHNHHDTGEPFLCGLRELLQTGGDSRLVP